MTRRDRVRHAVQRRAHARRMDERRSAGAPLLSVERAAARAAARAERRRAAEVVGAAAEVIGAALKGPGGERP